MKRIVEDTEPVGIEAMLGENVLLLCMNYFYYGKLTGVNTTQVELSGAQLVYETGKWDASKWQDAQALPGTLYVKLDAIEAYLKVSKQS